MSEVRSIGFVGLGAMGGRMAGALLEGGSKLVVFDERPEAMAPLVERGARRARVSRGGRRRGRDRAGEPSHP